MELIKSREAKPQEEVSIIAALLACSRDNGAGTMLLQYAVQSSPSITERAMIWPSSVHALQRHLCLKTPKRAYV
jgi:hypothetical protein